MPADDRFGLDDQERVAPPAPEAGKPDPEEAIAGVQDDSPASELALQDEHLVAKDQNLGSKRRGAPEKAGKGQQESARGRTHAAARCSGLLRIFKDLDRIEFSGTTGTAGFGGSDSKVYAHT
jgi:hypothetical protein